MGMKDQNINFLRKKDYKFIREIGQGGTGRTILIKDDEIDEIFVCKKYSPVNTSFQSSYYPYFKNEIKILHTIYHQNIVRIFNYYLYPEKQTGYILMEFICGTTISDFLIKNPDKINDIFYQTIEGFRYLEEIKILHRDIRPENLLVSEKGIVKIIDFGFGKQTEFESEDKSISLNWRYTPPYDFKLGIYDSKTEVYFIGKLFEDILKSLTTYEFRYLSIISKMINEKREARIISFFQVYREIINVTSNEIEFTESEKNVYREFATNLTGLVDKIDEHTWYNNIIEDVTRDLKHLYKNSMLEENIQNNNKLLRCFITGKFSYYTQREFSVTLLGAFLEILEASSDGKKKVIFNNLWERFDNWEKMTEAIELPF
jgi:eukaryotic-like serine/threonine-protein kinase